MGMNAKDLVKMIEKGAPDDNELAVKQVTISMPWLLYRFCAEAILAEGFSSVSDYVQGLIRDDKLKRDERSVAWQATITPPQSGGMTAERPGVYPQQPPPRKLGFEKEAETTKLEQRGERVRLSRLLKMIAAPALSATLYAATINHSNLWHLVR